MIYEHEESWQEARRHAETRIKELRDALESEDDIAYLRGQLKAWRELLTLPTEVNHR